MIAWSRPIGYFCQVLKENMKRTLFFSALGLALTCTAWAQPESTNAPPPPPAAAPPVRPGSPLSAQEDQEVNKAHSAALTADPSLNAEERNLWGKLKAARAAGAGPPPDLMVELRDFNAKLEAAMIKIDPQVEPLLHKLDAAHPHQP